MTRAWQRLPSGGRIDRAHPIRFALDGRILQGFAGDTLASALLANDVALVGRSYKYHRPRGFVAAGAEEPNGLFTLGSGSRTTPNVVGTLVDLYEGLEARRQNGWPSVNFDLMAVFSWATPLLPAGFYYKTFMGPRRGSWMFYERFIRRAAGFGRVVKARDPDRYDNRHVHTDVLVIGSGPAGLAAALTAGRSGARVLLVEQDGMPGGSLLQEPLDGAAARWLQDMLQQLAQLPNVQVQSHTTALGLYDGNCVPMVERRDHLRPDPLRGEAREILTTIRAASIVFATGAIERPLLFAHNDRPGVMLASAVRTYVHRFGVAPTGRVVVATNNDGAYAAAMDLARVASRVTILDQRQQVDAALLAAASAAGVQTIAGATLMGAVGARAVRGVRYVRPGSGREEGIDCDLIAMSGGWSPVVHLTSHTGIKPVYREDLDAFVPGGFAPGHFGAGAILGMAPLSSIVAAGAQAGRDAAVHAGIDANANANASPKSAAECTAPDVVEVPYRFETARAWPAKAGGKAFVDFQSDATTSDVAVSFDEGFESIEHLKRYTALGMGTDQGKTSNVNGVRLMAQLRGMTIAQAGTTTFRPPYTPVSIGVLAGRSVGHHFRPVRRTPLHQWHVDNGATLIEAGAWLRPWFYAWAGDTSEKAYVEEMRHVRSAVGISDVSSLGKIDVQGPDAAEFLNRVYVNGFAKLPVGKARYGVMLNDDATVLDDGTTACFAPGRYFMTTTTAQAAEVMSRLEFLLQTAWTDLRVQVVSVTDQWAGMSVAGPRARRALELALPGFDFSNEALPYMGCLEIQVDGTPVRILRLSFSGELAFELYAPADRGTALWAHVLQSAASTDIKPYGLESLASLRIEKGHVAGLELDHRTTLDDLGLGKMAPANKAFIGRELRQRSDLQAPERWSLVGLECLEPQGRLRGGAILFAATDTIAGHGRGYITSVTWSTERGCFIALGLYQGGLKHEGEEIVCAYPLKNETVRARIVSPLFIDVAGERLRV